MYFNKTQGNMENAILLTKREQQILKLICNDLTSEEIAGNLQIGKRTVDSHRLNIYRKTGCKSVVSLIKFAVRNKIVEI